MFFFNDALKSRSEKPDFLRKKYCIEGDKVERKRTEKLDGYNKICYKVVETEVYL